MTSFGATNVVLQVDSDGDGTPDQMTLPGQPHDFGVVSFKAPKKVNLTAKRPSVSKSITLKIQNNGPSDEIIPDVPTLSKLISLNIESLGDCSPPTPVLVSPIAFPITLSPKKKLKVTYQVMFNCPNDPAASTATASHPDYRYRVSIYHEAIDGSFDTHPMDNTLAADVLTDVVVK